jgi:hypothetical protein
MFKFMKRKEQIVFTCTVCGFSKTKNWFENWRFWNTWYFTDDSRPYCPKCFLKWIDNNIPSMKVSK